MSALSWRTERCAPRRSFLVVSSANQRSTRFSQDELVGVKCKTKRGWAASQLLDRRRLVGGAVVEDQVHVEVVGDLAVDGLQELLELDRAVAAVQRADHLAGRDVQRGVEAGGARALVVVGGALRGAGQHRQDRRGAIQGLDLGLLVDAEHDGALGRVEVEPDDVADLGDELRVLGELPGLLAMRLQPERPPDPLHRRLREADLARPSTASTNASRPSAWSPSVLTITSSTCSSVIVRGRPGRGSSVKPVKTVLDKPRAPLGRPRCDGRRARCAISLLFSPSAANNTIRDRNANACALVRRRVHDSNWDTLSRRQLDRLKHRGGHDHTLPACTRINASRH